MSKILFKFDEIDQNKQIHQSSKIDNKKKHVKHIPTVYRFWLIKLIYYKLKILDSPAIKAPIICIERIPMIKTKNMTVEWVSRKNDL